MRFNYPDGVAGKCIFKKNIQIKMKIYREREIFAELKRNVRNVYAPLRAMGALTNICSPDENFKNK